MSSLEKSLLILKRLGDPPYELSLSDIADYIGMGKSGAFKLLNIMKNHNFVVLSKTSRKYHLGPIMLRLGNVYGKFNGIREIAKPILTHITESLRETTYISIWEGERAFPAYKKPFPGGIYDYNDFIGKSIPLNAGGSAMLLCAYQDSLHIREIIDSIDLLMAEYRKIREQGYVIEDETFSLGVVSIAVPVFDKNNLVGACLALAAPKDHATEEKISEWLQALRNGAEELSYKLQFRH